MAEWYKLSQLWRRYMEQNLIFEVARIEITMDLKFNNMHYVCGLNTGCPFTA